MGLFDMLGIGGTAAEREARSIAKLQKKVVEKFGPPENRQGAVEELGQLRTEAAIDALLMRFTIRIDPGITDDDEKKRTLDLIVDAGELALPSIKRFIATRDEISWPLKALGDLVPEFEVVKVLVDTLKKAAGEYARVPEKKVLLLHAAATHKGPELVAAALPFLEDMDDEVVIAAAHVIAVQAAQNQPAPGAAAPADAAAAEAVTASIEVGREPLIQTFLRAHEQKNQRIKDALAGLLAESHWDVKGYTPKVEAALDGGYKVDSKGKVGRK
jgi:hypothetical protein